MELFKSQNRRLKLGYKGYIYTRDKIRKNHVTWQCEKMKCKGRAKTPSDYSSREGEDIVTVTQDHTGHIPNGVDCDIARIKTRVFELQHSEESAEKIAEDLLASTSSSGRVGLRLRGVRGLSKSIKALRRRQNQMQDIDNLDDAFIIHLLNGFYFLAPRML
ncbi:unnamed protein product [Notodromas monacha]|uniref:FLYWCH-type domain-containing protein n=1 Tax=Notodromas monacha TaxID=399045 RepID=A0A7R9GJN5_9CRUS|nr:unnamed protein product [Notodromas monacha]CAG0923860.1 unnamed protein product [Notodromas monacha]